MQRRVADGGDSPPPPRRCDSCGGQLRSSHRVYAGAGTSALVRRCQSCGLTVTGAPRADEQRNRRDQGRSRRHRPVDEGPPSNPVLDEETARRLHDLLGG